MSDDFESLMLDLENALSALSAITNNLNTPSEDFTLQDPERVVSVDVAMPAQRVTGIRIASGWEDRIEADQLEAAINLTLGKAIVRSLGMDPDAEADDQVPVLTGEDASSTTHTAAERAELDAKINQLTDDFEAKVDANLKRPGTLNKQLHEELDRFDRNAAQFDESIALLDSASESSTFTLGPDDREITSENRQITGIVSAGQLAQIHINERWLETPRSGIAITKTINELFEQIPEDSTQPMASSLSTLFGGIA